MIRDLCCVVARLSTKDAAEHTRADALRSVLKTGRRHKTPLVLPALCVDGEVLSDPTDIQKALASHFAEPEHGSSSCVQGVADAGCPISGGKGVIDLSALPSLSEVIQGWVSLQDRKAAGASGIPAKAYKYAALEAAGSHSSLFVKICARDQWPVLWRGTLNVAIPKLGKDGARMQSWRSIAFSEATQKELGVLCVIAWLVACNVLPSAARTALCQASKLASRPSMCRPTCS